MNLNIKITLSVIILFTALVCLDTHGDFTKEDAEKVMQAQKAAGNGQHTRAIQILNEVKKRYPNEPDLPRLLTHSYYELEQFNAARKAAVEAIGLGRLSNDMLTRLVQIDQQLGRRLSMLQTVRLLTITDPSNSDWHLLLAGMLMENNQYAEAEAIYRKLGPKSKNQAELWSHIGQAQYKQEQYSNAVISFETAWRMGHRTQTIARQLAGLYQRLGDSEMALNWIEKTLSMMDQIDHQLQLQQTQLLLSIGESDRARTIAQQLVKVNDNSIAGQAAVVLSYIALQKQETQRAIEAINSAESFGVYESRLNSALGKLYFNNKEYTKAGKRFAKHAQQNPEDETHSMLAVRAFLLAKDIKNTESQLQNYIAEFGMDAQAREIIQQMAEIK